MTWSATLFLVRHGQTPLNAAGVLRGCIDAPLDELGRHEARLLAGVFDTASLAGVLSSPLRRVVKTAAAIAEAAGLPVEVDDDLADRDYGGWADTSQADAESEFGSLEDVPGIEVLDSFVPRVTGALARAADRAAPGAVVVVAHDAVNRQVLASLVPSLGQRRVSRSAPAAGTNCVEMPTAGLLRSSMLIRPTAAGPDREEHSHDPPHHRRRGAGDPRLARPPDRGRLPAPRRRGTG